MWTVCIALEATRLTELSTQLTAEATAAKQLAETEANERQALQVEHYFYSSSTFRRHTQLMVSGKN